MLHSTLILCRSALFAKLHHRAVTMKMLHFTAFVSRFKIGIIILSEDIFYITRLDSELINGDVISK